MNSLETLPQPPIDTKTVRKVWWVCPHKTGDSFMLMLYASKDHKIVEYLWNSREGVTPFGILARDDKTTLYHEAWDHDIYCPNYEPPVGMRIFVGLTRQRAKEAARRNVEKWWTTSISGVRFQDRHPDKEAAIREFAEHYYSEHGEGETPDIIEVDDAWLAARKDAIANATKLS
jgi:hypothetical protein